MMYLAHGSVDGAIQAAQIAAVASVIGAIVSIIIAVYNNRMRLKAEEKMYVAKIYIEKSTQLQQALDKLWREIKEINKVIFFAYNRQQSITSKDMLNNEAYRSLKEGLYASDWLEIERIWSYYPELIEDIKDLKKSFRSYHYKLQNSMSKPEEKKLAYLLGNKTPDMKRSLTKVKAHLQLLVTKKIRTMNDDNKSLIGRFIEWLGRI